jgi:GT2 family glycosyltransferase
MDLRGLSCCTGNQVVPTATVYETGVRAFLAIKTASVVINWGPPKDTLAALQSLAAMNLQADFLICVDNGSSASDLSELRRHAPSQTILLELPANVGFPGAINIGMERALAEGVDWTLILNNDATVSPNCLAECVHEAMNTEKVAVVGPAVTFADRPDLLWFAGGEVSDWFAFTRHRSLKRPATKLPPTSDTEFVSACCALLSSDAWRSIGPFRSDYGIYYEDAEWCQRARKAGWRCRYLGQVLCRHAVSSTMVQRGSLGLSENAAYYLARNPMRFALDTENAVLRVSRVVGLLTIWATYNGWRILLGGRARVAGAYLQGLRDAVRGHMGLRST